MPRARQEIVVVTTNGDTVATGDYLADLGGPADQRLVVRPTPGESDPEVLGKDVLLALGKNPQIIGRENLRGDQVWPLARAWLSGWGIGDVVVDRAHRLNPNQLGHLVELIPRGRLWLIYGGDDAQAMKESLAQPRRRRPRTLTWHRLPSQLPPVQAGEPPPAGWPALPVADFTTFLAACRRHLTAGDFDRVADLYYPAGKRAERWATIHAQMPEKPLGTALTGWLRDEQLVDAHDPAAALVVLRATQAGLILRGLRLCWTTTALGADPARRLPGDLTAQRAAALHTFAHTGPALITALSLHLNLPPNGFACWRLGDVTADARTIGAPVEHADHPPNWPDGTELACDAPVTVPAQIRPLLAAHLAYRRTVGRAGDTHSLFGWMPATASPGCGPPFAGSPPASTSTRRGCTRSPAGTAPTSASPTEARPGLANAGCRCADFPRSLCRASVRTGHELRPVPRFPAAQRPFPVGARRPARHPPAPPAHLRLRRYIRDLGAHLS